MDKVPDIVVKELDAAISEGVRTLDRVSESTDKLSARGSAALVGCLTGLIGATTAYIISVALPVASFFFIGPLGLGIGAAGGILLYRGRTALGLDRDLENKRRQGDYILGRINALPKNAPDDVVADLWSEYKRITIHKTIDIMPVNHTVKEITKA